MKNMIRFGLALFVVACVETNPMGQQGDVLQFDIAAHTVDCVGVTVMKCLVVNGEWFYDDIEGYSHQEGTAQSICVRRTKRPEPIPQDVGIYVYQKVNCT